MTEPALSLGPEGAAEIEPTVLSTFHDLFAM